MNPYTPCTFYIHAHTVLFFEKKMRVLGACRRGDLETLKKLWTVDELVYHFSAFEIACERGHLDIAQWLLTLSPVNVHARDEVAFRVACEHGHLEIAKWLLTLGPVNVHALDNYAFRFACFRSHFETAKWLWSLGGMGVYDDVKVAFHVSCAQGNLLLVEWLSTVWDMRREAAFAFHAVCARGQLDLAKVLYAHAQRFDARVISTAFQSACCSAHWQVAKWLLGLEEAEAVRFPSQSVYCLKTQGSSKTRDAWIKTCVFFGSHSRKWTPSSCSGWRQRASTSPANVPTGTLTRTPQRTCGKRLATILDGIQRRF